MAFFNIDIRKPTDVTHAPPFLSILIYFEVGLFDLIRIGYFEPKMTAVVAEPKSVFRNHRKDFFICYSIHVADNDIMLLVFFQKSNIFTKQRKRWVGYNKIRFAK